MYHKSSKRVVKLAYNSYKSLKRMHMLGKNALSAARGGDFKQLCVAYVVPNVEEDVAMHHQGLSVPPAVLRTITAS
jgi:hypothetical protein